MQIKNFLLGYKYLVIKSHFQLISKKKPGQSLALKETKSK